MTSMRSLELTSSSEPLGIQAETIVWSYGSSNGFCEKVTGLWAEGSCPNLSTSAELKSIGRSKVSCGC